MARRDFGIGPDELAALPYGRFYREQMAPLPAEVSAASAEPAAIVVPRTIAGLLESESPAPGSGWSRLTDGTVFVTCRTAFPGATPEMLDWWFWWHGVESQRYKLWHPRAHVAARFRFPERLADPSLNHREKYVGNDSFVDELIGGKLQRLVIRFREPAKFGLDTSRLAACRVGTAICGVVGLARLPVDFATMVHLVQETAGGCELRSHFWVSERLGFRGPGANSPLHRLVRNRLVRRLALPPRIGRDLLEHCSEEYTHLASFLPDLWREFGGTSP